MKTSIINNRKKLISIIVIIGMWQILSVFMNPMLIPTPYMTLKEVLDLFKSASFYQSFWASFYKLIVAMSISILIGSTMGIFFGIKKKLKPYIDPLIGIMQSVPPIAWIGVAIIWLGINEKPSILIVIIATLPIIFINIYDGYVNIDTKLLEMCKIYNISQKKTITNMILPALKPSFKTAIIIASGLGWKLTIMSEVLISVEGLGNLLSNARLNFRVDKVFAISVILALGLGIIQKLITLLFYDKEKKNAD